MATSSKAARRVVTWTSIAWFTVAWLSLPGSAHAEDRVLKLTDGSGLRYGLHLPDAVGDEPLPLVVALHYSWGGGTTSPPAYYGRDYMNLLVVPGLADLEAIIVAPDCPGRGWWDERSDAALLELIAAVREEFAVDPDRIVLTGFSMGGMGTWAFAFAHPELFSAAVPMAGRPSPDIVAGWEDLPVFAIHGTEDEVVDIEPTREAIAALRERGIEAKLLEVPSVTHFQTPRFAEPMRTVVPWLRQLWERQRTP
jgi:predicted peptidase